MSEETVKAGPSAKLAPGDIVAIKTDAGMRHVQVTHARAPYPDVVRAILPDDSARSPAEIASGGTAFAAMVELARSLKEEPETTAVVGRAAVPDHLRAFPTFRVPIRDRSGAVVYWWTWDGEGLDVAPEAADTDMPLREILPIAVLRTRLAGLTR